MSDTHPHPGRRNGSAAKANGTPHPPYAPGTPSERHNSRTAILRSSRQRARRDGLKLAGFVAPEIQGSGAPVWPIHPGAWFHPELKARLPESSGLTIEKYRQLPAPDLLPLEVTPAAQSHLPDEVCDPLLPQLAPRVPPSDLAPSGWDPRVVSAPEVKRGIGK